MSTNISSSINKLQEEILKIKGEQQKLESLGKVSEAEQRRIDEALKRSTDLVNDYKQQLTRELETHNKYARSMVDQVEQQVKSVLESRKGNQD